MSIKDDYKVRAIPREQTYDWLLKKHYAHRIPSISYAFGLYDKGNILQGVCTFGYPPNYEYNDGKCVFKNYKCLTLELNRLVINDGMPRNVLSYFVASNLKMLPKPSCIVSYADPNNGHLGYIYQATNWIYSGESTGKKKYIFEDGSTFDIRRGIDKKGKIISVGTTTTRTLETIINKYKTFKECSGFTDIFIYPGYKFKGVDSLITNFHLPKSTLLMLVSALASKDNILKAYNIAIENKYRFFSFGDAMLIK